MSQSRSSGSSRAERAQEALPPNPYSALGVPENADSSLIRNAYRKLVLTYHPDRVTDPGKKGSSAERFRKVQEAYELLNDEARLAQYNARAAGNQNPPRSTKSTYREHDRPTHNERTRSTHGESSRSSRHHPRSAHGKSSHSNRHHTRSTHGESSHSNRHHSCSTHGESSRSSSRHHARPSSGEYRSSSRNRSREYRPHEPNRSSESPYPNMAEFPLRAFYPCCEICGDERCIHEHRWYTRLGFITDMTSRGVSLNGARAIAEERFGPWDDYELCETCCTYGCTHPHRIFTREGFVWEQLATRGEDSTDAIVAARIRAWEEFGQPSSSSSYRHEQRSRSSSGASGPYGLFRPFASTFSFPSSYSRRPLGSSWRDDTYDSVSYADELRQRRRYLDEDRYGAAYRTFEWHYN